MRVDKAKFDDLLGRLIKAKPLPRKGKDSEETEF
jgi:hypothetical protein